MVTVPQWTYNGQIITEIDDMPEGTYGFIYKVVHTPSQKKYIGKKVLYFERNKRLGKRALEALREERAKKGIKGRVPLKQKVYNRIRLERLLWFSFRNKTFIRERWTYGLSETNTILC